MVILNKSILGEKIKQVKKIKRKINRDEFEIRDLREKYHMVDNAYLNGWAKKCGQGATLVYYALCRYSDSSQTCYPSISLLSDKLDMSKRVVTRSIRTLEAFNIIKVERPAGFHNKYWLTDKTCWKEHAVSWIKSTVPSCLLKMEKL